MVKKRGTVASSIVQRRSRSTATQESAGENIPRKLSGRRQHVVAACNLCEQLWVERKK